MLSTLALNSALLCLRLPNTGTFATATGLEMDLNNIIDVDKNLSLCFSKSGDILGQ